MFKDKELRKAKSVVDQEKKEWFKKSMVETIQQIRKTQTQTKGSSTTMEGWNTTWLGIPNITPMEEHKSQEIVNSQEKPIKIEKIFPNIGKQMLKTNYTLSLGQLLKIAPKLKKYLWQKLKLDKTLEFKQSNHK